MAFRNPVTTAEDPVARQAAADAQSTATSALAAAAAKNTIYFGETEPAAPDGGFTVGDQWLNTTTGTLNFWTGSAWEVQQLGSAALAAGSVVAGTIAAGAINGMTITGATVQTAAPGNGRVVLSSSSAETVQLFTGAANEQSPAQVTVELDPNTGRPILVLQPGVVGATTFPGATMNVTGPSLDGTDPGFATLFGDWKLTATTPKGASSIANRGYVDGRSKSGQVSATTNANGDISIAHGLGKAPSSWLVEVFGTGAGAQFGRLVPIAAPDATSLIARLYDTRNGSALTGFAIVATWTVWA